MANFVRDAKRFKWAPSTLADHILVIKLIISSATDAEGEELFPRTWKRRVISAPRVERDKQHTPCLTRDEVETLLRKAKTEQERLTYAFLCGSGLRVSAAQAVRFSGDEGQTSWNPETAVVSVRLRYRMAQRVPDAAPHAARRFRISWLRKCRVLEEIVRSQVGHSDVSVTDTYSFQDENTVRAAVEGAGLGFNLA